MHLQIRNKKNLIKLKSNGTGHIALLVHLRLPFPVFGTIENDTFSVHSPADRHFSFYIIKLTLSRT